MLGKFGQGLKNILNNDSGFFQGGKSFGGLGVGGFLGQLGTAFKPQPYAGIPGICPYTGKPLRTPTEKASGVSDSISRAQQTGINPNTQQSIQFAPTTGKFGALNQQLLKGNQ